MNLKEMFICAKTRDQASNEDALVMTDELVAVIDGVTAKTDKTWEGMKPGLLARNLMEEELYTSSLRNMDAEKFFTKLDNAIARNVKRLDPNMEDNERPKASVLVYNDIKKEIWLYGDSWLRINDTVYPQNKKVDDILSDVRSFVITEALERGATKEEIMAHDIGREAIIPLLLKQSTMENTDGEWGYPVLAGKGINPSLIKVWKVEEGDEIVLASDGYPDISGTLEDAEKKLTELLENDPLCIAELKSTKCITKDRLSYDDRTYVRFTV